jgi:hypothetical protein
MAYHINRGSYGETNLDGLNVLIIDSFKGNIWAGDGKTKLNVAIFFDEKANEQHVTYIFSPNGTVEVSVRSSDTPFRLETDQDESVIFSFLGQVRDRPLYHVSDMRATYFSYNAMDSKSM